MNIDCLKDVSSTYPTFIFIDGSYFCFYRYHALISWWKNAYPDEITVLQAPYSEHCRLSGYRHSIGAFDRLYFSADNPKAGNFQYIRTWNDWFSNRRRT